VPLCSAFTAIHPNLLPIRVEHPNFGGSVEQKDFHFPGDLIGRVALRYNLHSQRWRAHVVVSRLLAGVRNAHVGLQPTAVWKPITHLMMNLPKHGGSFTDADFIQDRNEAQIQAFSDLIVLAFRRRQFDQLAS
jgi:hypothetical protein